MFDPVHQGHLHLANTLATELELTEVRIIPCAKPAHRTAAQASTEDRCNMLQLALEPHKKLTLDKREIQRQGTSYTVDTIKSLKEEGYTQIYLLMGSDSFSTFCDWHNWQSIIQMAKLVVAKRPGVTTAIPEELKQYICKQKNEIRENTENTENKENKENNKNKKIYITTINAPNASSSTIRKGETSHLPQQVADYITKHQLYHHAW